MMAGWLSRWRLGRAVHHAARDRIADAMLHATAQLIQASNELVGDLKAELDDVRRERDLLQNEVARLQGVIDAAVAHPDRCGPALPGG
jgi:hypothetical protein